MLKSGLSLFLGLLLGRFLGLSREILIANDIGVSLTADYIIALITLPDIFIGIFIGNSVAAVFAPKIHSLAADLRFGYFLKLSFYFGVTFLLLIGLCIFNINTLANWILPAAKDSPLFVTEFKIVLFTIPILALNAVSRAFLQTEGRFLLLGLENAIFNVCILGAIYIFRSSFNLRDITLAILIGAILRWASQIYQILKIYKLNITGFKQSINLNDFSRYHQAFFAGAALQIIPILGRSIVSFFEGAGGLSSFNYTYKFVEFPMALGFSIVSIIVFPKLTKAFVQNDLEMHKSVIKKSHDFILATSIPISLLISSLLFSIRNENLSLNNIPSEILTTIFLACSIGFLTIPIRGLNELQSVIFNSMNNLKSPLITTLIGGTVGLICVLLFSQEYGVIGCFVGLSIGYIVQFALNTNILRQQYNFKPSEIIFTKKNFTYFLRSILSCTAYLFISQHLPLTTNFIIWISLVLINYLFLFKLVKIEWKNR